MRMNTAAKRTAVAQFLFNFLGVLLFLPFIGGFSLLIEEMGGSAPQQVANAHLIFNSTCATVFLLAIKPFSSLIMYLMPQKDGEVVFITEHIPPELPEDISAATTLVEKEIVHMLDVAGDIFESTLQVADGKIDLCSRVVQLRDYIEFLHSQIISAILSLSDRQISLEGAARLAILARVADLCGLMAQQTVSMARVFEVMKDKKMALSSESYAGIQEMAVPCRENIEYLSATFPEMPEDIEKQMRLNDERLRQLLNWNYKGYLIRLAAKSSYSDMFSEILFSFERIGSIIRELRKTSIVMGLPAPALHVPDLINPPDQDDEAAGHDER